MIITTLYNTLLSLNYPVKPFGTDTIEDCILYKLIPLNNDGVIEQDRLEITAISTDLLKAQQIIDKVKDALLTIGDAKFNNEILEISLNGGGSLENLDTGTYHLKAYFIIQTRYRKD